MTRKPLSDDEWSHRMIHEEIYEDAYSLAILIERDAVCRPCRESRHAECALSGIDLLAGGTLIDCKCSDLRGKPCQGTTP